jgi:hypothetical protein
MSSRDTKTEKWQDKDFRLLPPECKLMFLYLIDNCDIAGFWEIDSARAAFETGLNSDQILGAIKGLARPCVAGDKYLWVRNFIKHQNNLPLNNNNNCHKGIIKRLLEHKDWNPESLELLPKDEKINPKQGAVEGLNSPYGKGKGKGKGKERECEGKQKKMLPAKLPDALCIVDHKPASRVLGGKGLCSECVSAILKIKVVDWGKLSKAEIEKLVLAGKAKRTQKKEEANV